MLAGQTHDPDPLETSVGKVQEKRVKLPIAILAPDPANPRTMSDEARAGLAVSLETFGALDIVFNDETGELVSGHQRLDGLKAAGATELVREGDWGHIVHPKTGERFPVRFVRWDPVKQRMANLAANSPHLRASSARPPSTNFAPLRTTPTSVLWDSTDWWRSLKRSWGRLRRAKKGSATPTTCPRRQPSRFRGWATCGSWATTGCSAGTRRRLRTWRGCWALRIRT